MSTSKYKLFFKYQKHLLPFLRKAIVSFLTSNIYILTGMATLLITKALIDYAYPYRDVSLLTLFIFAQIAIFFIQQYFNSLSTYLDMYVDNALIVKLKGQFYDKLQELSLRFHSEKQVGDLIYRMDKDIGTTVGMITKTISVILNTFLQLGFLLFICVSFDWRLTLLALSGIPLYFLETSFFAQKHEAITEKELKKSSDITSYLQERLSTIKIIKSFGRERIESRFFGRKIRELFLIMRESHIVEFLNSSSDSAIKIIWLAMLGWYAGYHVIIGMLSVGEVVVITSYVAQIYGPVMRFGRIYKFIIEGGVSVRRIDEILSRQPEIKDEADAEEITDVKGTVTLKNVSFSYVADKPVLKAIDLDIKAGTNIALMGPSGVGKTTLTDLILRFYDPTEGQVLIDGKDVRKVKNLSLRRQVGIVGQEITIFKGTVQDNIKFGNENVSFDKVVQAAKLANAHEFIERLPDGYNTVLPERGASLSSGQRQRLTIARAFIRNPRILILDEATTALDPESSAFIHNALMKFKQGRTVISIAHRLSTVLSADQIVLLYEGRVAEKGSFMQLMDLKGKFYTFFEKEFGQFRIFSERLNQEILRVKRYKTPFSLIMLEMRDIGKIASAVGEKKLNEAFEEVENIIHKTIRIVDFDSKYQEDRFLIGLPHTGFEGAIIFAHRIRKILNTHVFLKDDKNIHLVFEAGISSMDEKINTTEALYRNAEHMLETNLKEKPKNA